MLKSIEYCFNHKKISSFYCNKENTNLHLTGYIARYNDSEILISHINSHGNYDGFILKHIEDIYRIDYDGEYENRIERLYKLKNQSHNIINTFNSDEEILYSLLDYAKENDYIASLEFQDNFISGLINGYDNSMVYLSIINEYGTADGTTIIDIDEVISVAIDTDDEQDLRILYKANKDMN